MAAAKSLGTSLTINSTVISDLNAIGEAKVTSDELDVTTLDSSDGYREFIAGFKDGGEITFAGPIKDETDVTALWALAEAQTVVACLITTPSGSTLGFNAFVKTFAEDAAEVDGVRGLNGSLRVSGAFTYTPVV